jgi:hypothetical protein
MWVHNADGVNRALCSHGGKHRRHAHDSEIPKSLISFFACAIKSTCSAHPLCLRRRLRRRRRRGIPSHMRHLDRRRPLVLGCQRLWPAGHQQPDCSEQTGGREPGVRWAGRCAVGCSPDASDAPLFFMNDTYCVQGLRIAICV